MTPCVAKEITWRLELFIFVHGNLAYDSLFSGIWEHHYAYLWCEMCTFSLMQMWMYVHLSAFSLEFVFGVPERCFFVSVMFCKCCF